jgi:lysozyme family protein
MEAATGVPSFVLAVIHEREAGGRWDRQLGQGDHLNGVSAPVPRGEGPSTIRANGPGHDAFHGGALDALTNCRALETGPSAAHKIYPT